MDHSSAAPAGHIHDVVKLSKDHVSMVKFDSPDEDAFKAVLHYLDDIIKSVRDARGAARTGKRRERDEDDGGPRKRPRLGTRVCF